MLPKWSFSIKILILNLKIINQKYLHLENIAVECRYKVKGLYNTKE
jgi:hypothetical protein